MEKVKYVFLNSLLTNQTFKQGFRKDKTKGKFMKFQRYFLQQHWLFFLLFSSYVCWAESSSQTLSCENVTSKLYRKGITQSTLSALGFSGIATVRKVLKKLGKKSQSPTVVLSGSSPTNPFSLEKYTDTIDPPGLRFQKAYNKGEFTEDEVYILIPSPHFTELSLSAKIVDLKRHTIVADIFHPSGRLERRELNTHELFNAQLSTSSKRKFNGIDKVGAVVIPKSNQESALRIQGHRDIFANGVDDMQRLQAVGRKLREMNVNPFKTHIVDFANKVEDHIQFIRAGMIKQKEELRNAYLEQLSSHDFRSKIEQVDEQFKEDMEILERLFLEAKQKINEEAVSYSWWLHWNNRLSILASKERSKTQLIRTETDRSSKERKIISDINTHWWKTEENLNEYLDSQYNSTVYKPDDVMMTSVEYIKDAIDSFPDRVHLPTIEPYGIIAINMSAQKKIFPIGLVSEETWADNDLKTPADFYSHDLNDFLVSTEVEGLILNREFNDHFRRAVEGLSKRDREQVETVFFSIIESPQTLDKFNPEHINNVMANILQRFKSDKDLGGLLPADVNMSSEESIKNYLQKSANKFISISNQAL